MIKTCKMCGRDYITDSNNAKFCPTCRPEASRIAAREKRQQKVEEYAKVLTKCKTCGKVFHPRNSRNTYCSDYCQRNRPRPKPAPKKQKELVPINTAARAAGMTYGKWQSLKWMQETGIGRVTL